MPTQTERQKASDALHRAFLVSLIAEAESTIYGNMMEDPDPGAESASSHSSSTSSSSSSSSNSFEFLQSTTNIYLDSLANLYSQHYLNERGTINKNQAILRLLLGDWKVNRPEIFRSYLRVNPDCFDDLVEVIKDDPVFHNNSNNSQMPVEEQAAIALYRFGHYGNAASTMKVALQFGLSSAFTVFEVLDLLAPFLAFLASSASAMMSRAWRISFSERVVGDLAIPEVEAHARRAAWTRATTTTKLFETPTHSPIRAGQIQLKSATKSVTPKSWFSRLRVSNPRRNPAQIQLKSATV